MRLMWEVSKMSSEKSELQSHQTWKLSQKPLLLMLKLQRWRELLKKFILLPREMLIFQTKLLQIWQNSNKELDLQDNNLRMRLDNGILKPSKLVNNTSTPGTTTFKTFIMIHHELVIQEASTSPIPPKLFKTGEMQFKLTKTSAMKWSTILELTNNKSLLKKLNLKIQLELTGRQRMRLTLPASRMW